MQSIRCIEVFSDIVVVMRLLPRQPFLRLAWRCFLDLLCVFSLDLVKMRKIDRGGGETQRRNGRERQAERERHLFFDFLANIGPRTGQQENWQITER